MNEFAEPTARGVLDPVTTLRLCLFLFDNPARARAALGDPLEKVPHPRPTRGLLAPHPQSDQCFQGHSKTEPKKHRFLDAFLAHFCLHLPSILAQFWDDFPLQFWDQFPMRFFLIFVRFPTPPIFHFSALACTPCDFSSFRHVAKHLKTTSKYLQNWCPNQAKINKKTIKNSIKNYIRF